MILILILLTVLWCGGDANLYGVQPRYTVLEEDGNTHGVLILNSNAQVIGLTLTALVMVNLH